MALEPGTRLGPYEILGLLGEGGMGEVYRAFDSKLRRDVALKVLPKLLARDPERLTRFRREAQLLASLNHKNIAAIYGFEETPEANFLVLELVEGETFAERIQRQGPLPAKEALTLSGQVAEGLEAAHRKGITHRDIKPANIKVTPEGVVKVLDFGLAKVFAGDRAQGNLSELPTVGPGPTLDGQILGTPAYMSPEQVRGQDVDKRTDIWAFGCVLYELLTSQSPFKGETVSDTIANVLEREPIWESLPAETPEKVREVLRRCLRKDVARRLRDIGDASIEIEEVLATAVPPKRAATDESVRRQLSVIMFMDIRGFTAFCKKSDSLAGELLGEYRKVLRSIFRQYSGKEIKTIVDAFLVVFSSALGAAACAVEIQKTWAERNASAPPEKRLQIGIGMHMGDVLYYDQDVFGDDVNIAARLEGLAPPGGIIISEEIARQVQNKIQEPLLRAGKIQAVNRPVEVYQIVLPGVEIQKGRLLTRAARMKRPTASASS